MTMFIIPIIVIASMLIGVFLTIFIKRPSNVVVLTLAKMEKGDMAAPAYLQHGDELGSLSKALDNMSVRFQSIFKNIRQNVSAQ
ncbi:MAG: hypothetical protein LBC75_01240 [Fibromonadaceae bacterium]|nr:hypothetical protein [Fibromonadaceae bacterium]